MDLGNSKSQVTWIIPVIGVLIVVSLAIGIGWLAGNESQSRHQIPRAYEIAAKSEVQRACRGTDTTAVFECVYEHVLESDGRALTEQDLSAQQRAASSALITAITSIFALAASIAALWLLKRTLDATLIAVRDTSRATEAMERQIDLTAKAQRPWLELELVQISPRPKNHSLSIQVIVTNCSTTPAHDVRVAGFAEIISTQLRHMDHMLNGHDQLRIALAETQQGGAAFPLKNLKSGTVAHLTDPRCRAGDEERAHGVMLWLGISYSFDGGHGFTFQKYFLSNAEEAIEAVIRSLNKDPKLIYSTIPHIDARLEERSVHAI